MRNLVIGTAGHVDHGKTSLIKALTGINPDTLKEEQSRGITVNLGFAYLKLDDHHTVGIVDVPGHERFIKNMLAGVCGIDLILLTVAADDGIMPQTREHLEIIKFLKVENIICVITKTDLVSRERIDAVKLEIKQAFEIQDVVECSIFDPLSIENLSIKLKELLTNQVSNQSEPFRMPIDRVFTVKGQGVVITGSTLSGIVKVGDELEILPTKQLVKVRGIQSFNQARTEANKQMRVALNLGGVKKEDIKRGKVIATVGAFSTPTAIIDVKVQSSQVLIDPIKHLEQVKFYYLASEIKCRIKLIKEKFIGEGEIVYAQLLLAEAIFANKGDLGVLRRINPNKTIAGVEIINVYGEYVNRKDETYLELLRLYDQDNLPNLINHYIDQHPFVSLASLKEKLNIVHKTDELIVNITGDDCLLLAGGFLLTKKKFKDLSEDLSQLLKRFHEMNPIDRGMSKQLCQVELGLTQLGKRTFSQFLNLVGSVRVQGDQVKLADYTIQYTLEEQRQAKALKDYLDENSFQPPKLTDILLNVRGKAIKQLYYSLIRASELIQIEPDIVLTKEQYRKMLEKLDEFFKTNRLLMIKDLRDLLHTSRKYVVAYLEYLDKIGYTRRVEEGRIKK